MISLEKIIFWVEYKQAQKKTPGSKYIPHKYLGSFLKIDLRNHRSWFDLDIIIKLPKSQ